MTAALPAVFVNHLTHEQAERTLGDAIDRLWPATDRSRLERIVIKVNLCEYRRPESGAVTDPVLLEALIRALQRCSSGLPIFIAEADATSLDADAAFRYTSMDEVAKSSGAQLLNFSKQPWREIPLPGGKVFGKMLMPEALGPTSLYVNFAKLKINSGSKITGCLKNNFALIYPKRKAQFHGRIHEAVHDVNLAIKLLAPQLMNLIDGFIGVETIGGPAFGRPKRCELLLSGLDPVAVDACEARIIGMRPSSVKHLVFCAKAGIGTMSYCLETDIPNFKYSRYSFRFEGLQYWLKQQLKARVGMGA
jgi:uncharacterized protein (DUF362 family)